MLLLVVAVAIGFLMPLQTAVNSRLRRLVGSPFAASFVSFAIGTAVLLVALLVLIGPGGILEISSLALAAPIWQWGGGALGVFLLTINILAFAHLGGVETALWPIVGSVLVSIAVDAFGWFGVGLRPVTPLRALGALVVLVGGAMVAGIASRADEQGRGRAGSASAWIWRLSALVAGATGAVQGAVNSALGQSTDSPVAAAFISFATGALLIGMVAVGSPVRTRRVGKGDEAARAAAVARQGLGPWWMWLGGVFGALFVAVMVSIIPLIGVGPANVAALAGMSMASVCVDRFGWFEAPAQRVAPLRLAGIAVILTGVVAVQFG